MSRTALAAILLLALSAPGAAEEVPVPQTKACEKAGHDRNEATAREAIYTRATCLAATAGLSGSAESGLTRQELVSILLLMSAQPGAKDKAS